MWMATSAVNIIWRERLTDLLCRSLSANSSKGQKLTRWKSRVDEVWEHVLFTSHLIKLFVSQLQGGVNGQLFSLSNSGNTRTISDGISQRGFSEVVYRSFSSIPNEIYYWVLPESFRGDKVRGINKKTARLRDKRGNNCFRFLSEISLLFSPPAKSSPDMLAEKAALTHRAHFLWTFSFISQTQRGWKRHWLFFRVFFSSLVTHRWQLTEENFVTLYNTHPLPGHWWLMASQMWLSRATVSSWSITPGLSLSHVSLTPSLSFSERWAGYTPSKQMCRPTSLYET